MSVAERLQIAWKLLCLTSTSLLGWLLIAPIAALVPKRRDWLAVIGAIDGQFRDNAKYFFLQANIVAPELRIAFITEREDTLALFSGSSREVLRYPSFRAMWFLARCNVAVVDEANWFRRGRRFLLVAAHVVQLWHGVGIKRIESNLWQNETGQLSWATGLLAKLRLLAYRLTGRLTRYAVVVATSRFYRDEVFQPSFLAREFPVIGYPRNDFGRSLTGENLALAWRNVDSVIAEKIESWNRQGRRIVIVAPTFRDSGSLPLCMDDDTAATLDDFAETHHLEFIFKFHPSEKNAIRLSGKHLYVCARDSDIYPLLPHTAALITDYSSISMDYLLLDKPLLFLIPAGDEYATRDRQLQFDARAMMPGPVARNWPELLEALVTQWARDSYVEPRAALRTKAFDELPQSEAVPKLITLMRSRAWLGSATALAGL